MDHMTEYFMQYLLYRKLMFIKELDTKLVACITDQDPSQICWCNIWWTNCLIRNLYLGSKSIKNLYIVQGCWTKETLSRFPLMISISCPLHPILCPCNKWNLQLKYQSHRPSLGCAITRRHEQQEKTGVLAKEINLPPSSRPFRKRSLISEGVSGK